MCQIFSTLHFSRYPDSFFPQLVRSDALPLFDLANMFFPTVFTSLAFLSTTGWAQYVLEDDYTNGNFFDMFSFFNSSDPTHGFVDYVEQEYASDAGLINTNGGQVYMGVDHDNVAPSAGRPSVRITSTKSYNSGLVILDAAHMPEGCGTWPAFWMVGPNWPHQGEIGMSRQRGSRLPPLTVLRHHRRRQRPNHQRHDPTHRPRLQHLQHPRHVRQHQDPGLQRQRHRPIAERWLPDRHHGLAELRRWVQCQQGRRIRD